MKNWGMLYERQPLQMDAILLAVALMLHTPLVLVQMKGAPKRTHAKPFSRLVNIEFIEEQIKKRKEKPLVLPPKMPEAPKQLQDMVKKVEEVKQQIFKRSLPPPPPPKPSAAEPTIAKGTEVGTLQQNLLKDKLDQQQKILQGKGSFQSREAKLSGPDMRDLKIDTAGGAALQAGSRLAGLSGPQGGTLQGKAGFQVSKAIAPTSIGGGDESGLKIGGGNVIVLPVGAKSRADSSILSPMAAKKDRGPLMAQGAAGLSAPSASDPGLAGAAAAAPGAAAPIGGRSSLTSPIGGAVKEGKKLEERQLPSPLAEPAKSPTSAPALTTLPRRIAPRAQKPLFLITGPLANRQVLSRDVPAYPEWAREKGVESSVVLQFTVTPEGAVKDNIIVVRTSGYPQMDELATKALLKWKFAALPTDQVREEIGTITFNFSIQ